MNNSRNTLIIGLIGVLVIGFSIFSGSEVPSQTVRLMQYVFLAISAIAVVASLVQLLRK